MKNIVSYCFFIFLLFFSYSVLAAEHSSQDTLPKLMLQLGHQGLVQEIAFSNDKKQIASYAMSDDGRVDETIIWDTSSGRMLEHFSYSDPELKEKLEKSIIMKNFKWRLLNQTDDADNILPIPTEEDNIITPNFEFALNKEKKHSAMIEEVNTKKEIGKVEFSEKISDFLFEDEIHPNYTQIENLEIEQSTMYMYCDYNNNDNFPINFIHINNIHLTKNEIGKLCDLDYPHLDKNQFVIIRINLESGEIVQHHFTKHGETAFIEPLDNTKVLIIDKYAYLYDLEKNNTKKLKISGLNEAGEFLLFNSSDVTLSKDGKYLLISYHRSTTPAVIDLSKNKKQLLRSQALKTKLLNLCTDGRIFIRTLPNTIRFDENIWDIYDNYLNKVVSFDLSTSAYSIFFSSKSNHISALSPDCNKFIGKINDKYGIFSSNSAELLKELPRSLLFDSSEQEHDPEVDYSDMNPSELESDYRDVKFDDTGIIFLTVNTYEDESFVYLVDLTTGNLLKTWMIGQSPHFNISRNGQYFLYCGRLLGEFGVYDLSESPPTPKLLNTHTKSLELFNTHTDKNIGCYPAAISSEGMFLAIQGDDWDDNILINASTQEIMRHINITEHAAIFSQNDERLYIGITQGIEIRDGHTGELIETLNNENTPITSMIVSTDDRLLITSHENGVLAFWDVHSDNKHLLARMVLGEDSWLATTPDGRFDSNNLDSILQAHWIMPDDPLTPLPPEVFMRDYYEPSLLPRILACTRAEWEQPGSGACATEFPPLPALAGLNRAQPEVSITAVRPDPTQPGRASVEVKVKQTHRSVGEEAIKNWDSGVCDVRLFRDGQLVGFQDAQTGHQEAGDTSILAERDTWRKNNCLQVDGNGEATLTFPGIRLPQRDGTKQVTFSAYAFNQDRVKSETATETCQLVTQPQSNAQGCQLSISTQPRRAYIVTIGVEHFEYEKWDLNFAADDARDLRDKLVERLTKTGEFAPENIIPITLQAEKNHQTGEVISKTATKTNIQAVFQALAGQALDSTSQQALKAALGEEIFNQLQPATPDDLVLIAYSSHGYADTKGNFYLFPYDVGQTGLAGGVEAVLAAVGVPVGHDLTLRDFLQRTISSEDLSDWLRGVDAGELALIVDACYSEAGINQPGFKPAPMGSRGLGQLAYDKGMRVLTAASKNAPAYEKNGNGILTAALAKDGLGENNLANFDEPKDHRIELGEWLRYGVKRVPELLSENGVPRDAMVGIPVENATQVKLIQQQPTLFDFRKKNVDREMPVALIQ